MSVGLSELHELCNPDRYSRDAAITLGRKYAGRIGTFYISLTDFVRVLCTATPPEIRTVERTLDIIRNIAPERILCSAHRNVYASSSAKLRAQVTRTMVSLDPELILARKLLDDPDHRVRANLIEGLWNVNSPAAQILFAIATRDSHHRVAANAAYGLYLCDSLSASPVIENLARHPIPTFRTAAAWIIRKAGTEELQPLLRNMLGDTNPTVRKAAIKSQLDYRLRAAKGQAA